MRTLKAGIALALLGSFLLAPLSAATRQDGVISGSAAAEVKKPYDPYTVRARDVSTNTIAQKTTLDANAEFAVNGLNAGDVPDRARQERAAERRGRQDHLHRRAVHAAGQRVPARSDDQEGREHSLQPSGGGLVAARRGGGGGRHGRRRGRRQAAAAASWRVTSTRRAVRHRPGLKISDSHVPSAERQAKVGVME